MGRMGFTAVERVVPPATTEQPTARGAAGMGLTAPLFWGENQHLPEKVQQECKTSPFLHHFAGVGVSRNKARAPAHRAPDADGGPRELRQLFQPTAAN